MEYVVFMLGVLNTLTLTFYLIVDNYPELDSIFPNFTSYAMIISMVGFPLMILLGYMHIRRSSAYRSEVEVSIETNPYTYKLPPGIHREVLAPFFYEALGILKKTDTGEALSSEEIQSLNNLDKKLDFLVDGGILKKPSDFEGI